MDRAFGLGEVDGAALIDERAGRDKVLGEGGRDQRRAGQRKLCRNAFDDGGDGSCSSSCRYHRGAGCRGERNGTLILP